MATITQNRELAIVAVSGLSWPTKSRQYLIDLVKEVVAKSQAKFAIIAGHTIDGKYVEAEFKAKLKEHLAGFSPRLKGEALEWEKQTFRRDFIADMASELSEDLPVLAKDVNWHIAIAERIYDRPLGAEILEKLRDMRPDVRIIGERQEDGFYDREPKFPVQFPGFNEIRVLVPHRSPWFSKVITNLVQRIANAWSPRTLSPRPDLVLAGATGTATHLPNLDGIPTISVPALHKLLEQQATENMVGATVIKVIANGKEGVRIVNGVYNFRTAVFMEKRVAVSSKLPKVQQGVMYALIPSDASFKTVLFRINQPESRKRLQRKTKFTDSQVRKALEHLIKGGFITHSRKSNRYFIKNELRRNAHITLASLWEGSRAIKHVVWSCLHGGAMKTLYFTALHDLPELLVDADAAIENGDLMQGIAHNYLTNGELLPIANGVDKQEVLNAHIRAAILLEAFRRRLSRLRGRTTMKPADALRQSFIPYVYNRGNHDKWAHYNKGAIPLKGFDSELRSLLREGVYSICRELGADVTLDQVRDIVRERVLCVGDSRMVELDGITVGIKHPHKSRTIQKSTRIQQVAEFIWQRFVFYVGTVAKKSTSVTIVYVANFHEAAAAHITKLGQTVLGVMTGAYMYDTEFENHMDKVVDRGPAVVHAHLDAEGRLLYSETEFVAHMVECDREFVTSDRLDSKQVLSRTVKLLDRIGLSMEWR
ncbi:MAG TPA: hypothetical protein VD862_01910 [Candidatus Paceibacterota bacterium]|nr:hypothetical protein [Candidatus Paceibacterota bacterium]